MDISIKLEDYLFNYRAAALIKNDGKVLVHHVIGAPYVTLPGGRVTTGEDSITTLKREIKEEMDIDVEHVRSVATIENFFNEQNKGLYHELLMVHEMVFSNYEDYAKEIIPIEERKKGKLEFLWLDRRELEETQVRPVELKNFIINDMPYTHVIHNEI